VKNKTIPEMRFDTAISTAALHQKLLIVGPATNIEAIKNRVINNKPGRIGERIERFYYSMR
jgi:hypothetical protein